MNRSLAVTRMHLVDKRTLFGAPLGILALVVAINAAIWAFVPRDGRSTGGLASIYCFTLAIAVLAVVRGFPFAMGMGASRRAFSIGTMLMAGLFTAIFGTAVWVLGLIEEHTDGWGVGGHFFFYRWFGESGPAAHWLVVTLPFVVVFLLGGTTAAIYLRWGVPGVFVDTLLLIVAAGAGAVVLTAQHAWADLGSWLTGLTPVDVSGLLVAATLVLGLEGWLILRRTSL